MSLTILPKKPENRFKLELLYTISAPIITFPNCESNVTKENKTQYQLEGMLHIKEIFEKEEAPDYHAMIYLSGRSLLDPLDHTFSRIYLSLGKKYWGEKADWLKDVPPLDINEQEHLIRFKRWIFKKQIEYLKPQTKELKD